MTQCDSVLYNRKGEEIEQCQLGISYDGDHRFFIEDPELPDYGMGLN